MIQTKRPHLDVAASTHPGLSGKTNEDRFAVASYENAAGEPVLFAVVADGIGGHRAGEVAAQIAVDQILQEVARSDGSDPSQTMVLAIQAANQAIAEQAAIHDENMGMGCTCACVWVAGDRLYTAHVGDSRIYLVRGGKIHCTSVDHTWIQEAVEGGLIAPERAREHPSAHVLRRHLGAPESPEVDLRLRLNGEQDDDLARQNQGLQLDPGDAVLVCSDGLSDMMQDEEILVLVGRRNGLDATAGALVERANAGGGHDNITVVLIAIAQGLRLTGDVKELVRRVLRV